MKSRRVISVLMSIAMLISTISTISISTPVRAAEDPGNLVPNASSAETGDYVCTWNIQYWTEWHEQQGGKKEKSSKRDAVDPDHLFGDRGWVSKLYPTIRKDMYFLLDDGWDLPYNTKKTEKDNVDGPFASQFLPKDKFPEKEYGSTPQERLKKLNEKVKSYGWKGAGLWICAQRSNQPSKDYNKSEEQFWRTRLQWSKYAGIPYWKIDWGTEQKKITWRRKISEWAEQEYPELIIEHCVGGSGYNGTKDGSKDGSNARIQEGLLGDNVEFAAFSDVFRTYDVWDNLATTITLDRVGEQLLAGHTEKGPALGLMNAEDEMYIAAALGLSVGVMRFAPQVTADTKNSGADYYMKGVEKNKDFAGGKKFSNTKATRNRLDEVERTVRWHRIAPPYTVGDYETKLSQKFFQDDWTFTSAEPAWDGTTGTRMQKAPAVIARGIDLPKVENERETGGDTPYLAASRNPNGAISVACLPRTSNDKGYHYPSAGTKVSLDAGDLTGKIGIFGQFGDQGELKITFNQNLEGKKVYAQDLLADDSDDITSKVTIKGNTITIPGKVIREIGLAKKSGKNSSRHMEGQKLAEDTSDPGLVMQIGSASDFVKAPATEERIERYGVNNGSFERFVSENGTLTDITAADWSRWKDTGASYITEGGYSSGHAGIHKAGKNYEVSTYQLNKSVANGTYTVSAYVKSSGFSRNAPGDSHKTSCGMYALDCGTTQYVDIQKMGKLDDWTYIELPGVKVTNGQLKVEFYSYGAKDEWLMFDNVKVELPGSNTTESVAQPILEFDFSEHGEAQNGETAVKGIANGDKEVTATAKNVTITTDEDGNDVAVFAAGGNMADAGIIYTPGSNDPLKQLKSGRGAAVSMWIKTGESSFSSPLFSYGSRSNNGAGELGASIQIQGRNEKDGELVFYRNQSGQTGGQKLASSNKKPYTKDTWQLLTYVEEADGTGTLYVDGTEIGSSNVTGKTIRGFATDGNADSYYIGYLPYEIEGDTHFVGSIDSVTVYDAALTASQVQNLYNERFDPQNEIELQAATDGKCSGGAEGNSKYVDKLGKNGSNEGKVSFNILTKTATDWYVDAYYLSDAAKEYVITINGDTSKTVKMSCPAGNGTGDPAKAVAARVGTISLPKGKNTIEFGNPNGSAPALVKVVLVKLAVVQAQEVEQAIGSVATPDDVTMYDRVMEVKAMYDGLSAEAKALISEEMVNTLKVSVETLENWKQALDKEAADQVTELLTGLSEEVTEEQKDAVVAARSAYDALTVEQKKLVTEEAVQKLLAAENALGIITEEDQNARDSIIARIDSLNNITEEQKDIVMEVRAAYEALTERQKNLVPSEVYEKLTRAEIDCGLVKPQTDPETEAAKEELRTALTMAKAAYDAGEGIYTADSWSTFSGAYTQAMDALANPQELKVLDFQMIRMELQDAYNGLVIKKEPEQKPPTVEKDPVLEGVRTLLKNKLTEMSVVYNKGQQDYTDASWSTFVTRYEWVQKDQGNLDAEILMQYIFGLEEAQNGLKKKPTEEEKAELAALKKTLADMVEAAKTYKEEDYTAVTWSSFKEAYDAAVAASAENATEEKLNSAILVLSSAQKRLEKKPADSNPPSTEGQEQAKPQEPPLSDKEKKIMEDLGTTKEAAIEIAKIAEKYKVSEETLFVTNDYIKEFAEETDIDGASFAAIQVQSVKQTNTSIKIKWTKVSGADGYLIYGNKCGEDNEYKLVKEVKTKKAGTYTQKKLKKGTSYKYIVLAYKKVGGTKVTLAASKTVHVVTQGGTYGNAKSLVVKPAKVNLKRGKTKKLEAKEIVANNNKASKHRKICYESSDAKVASVSKTGKITAKKKGKCTIYVYLQNGIYKKVKVTVK